MAYRHTLHTSHTRFRRHRTMSKNKFSCALGADGGRDTSPLASRCVFTAWETRRERTEVTPPCDKGGRRNVQGRPPSRVINRGCLGGRPYAVPSPAAAGSGTRAWDSLPSAEALGFDMSALRAYHRASWQGHVKSKDDRPGRVTLRLNTSVPAETVYQSPPFQRWGCVRNDASPGARFAGKGRQMNADPNGRPG